MNLVDFILLPNCPLFKGFTVLQTYLHLVQTNMADNTAANSSSPARFADIHYNISYKMLWTSKISRRLRKHYYTDCTSHGKIPSD